MQLYSDEAKEITFSEMSQYGHILLAVYIFLFGNASCFVSVPFVRGPDPWSDETGLLKIQYYCNFRAPQVGLVTSESARLLVIFNQEVQDILNWNMLTLSPASVNRSDKVFVLTNENNTDFTNFQWSFHVVWKGDIDYGPPVRTSSPAPTGTCQLGTDLVTVPIERGSKPWSEGSGLLRIQYYCNFRAPQIGLVAGRMAVLLVMFNQDVQDVVNWNMITLSPASANRSAKVFVLTNENTTDLTNFQWSFHGIWKGFITNPEPTGTCQIFNGNAASTTLAPASITQAPESRSVSTSGYVGIGIGVFVLVLIAVAVIVIAYKKRRRQLHTEDPNFRYSPKADKCDMSADTENIPQPVPHGVKQKRIHSYLELDGAVYDEIGDVDSSILPPRRALPSPPGAKSSADDEYLTVVSPLLPRDIPAPLNTKDDLLLPVRVTSYEIPTTTDSSVSTL
ncbi:hypothetical protein DPMN_137226 [Dreissena polymorpha]|uniref:Uncharacterized protein n=1 Tax=Dreissena polymorpha TaxID=45954 RepID=A0A9D4JIM1_DREPO|nr:hypothetical protein DPMN_137226 [Dreissena polymorpha]